MITSKEYGQNQSYLNTLRNHRSFPIILKKFSLVLLRSLNPKNCQFVHSYFMMSMFLTFEASQNYNLFWI